MNNATESVRVGGSVLSAHASLRIFGVELDPEEISRLMGRVASTSYRAGDQVSPRVDTRRRTGMWILDSDLDSDRSLADHISALLGRLPNDRALWSDLASRFTLDLYCVVELLHQNSGLEVPDDVMVEIAGRRLSVQLDFYVVGKE